MRKIHFADYLEKIIAQSLNDAGIEFVHESESKEQSLDFYLPKFGVYLEIKQFHSERIAKQMAAKDNVIAIQGTQSVNFIIKLLKNETT